MRENIVRPAKRSLRGLAGWKGLKVAWACARGWSVALLGGEGGAAIKNGEQPRIIPNTSCNPTGAIQHPASLSVHCCSSGIGAVFVCCGCPVHGRSVCSGLMRLDSAKAQGLDALARAKPKQTSAGHRNERRDVVLPLWKRHPFERARPFRQVAQLSQAPSLKPCSPA